jgi:hypothetical protein
MTLFGQHVMPTSQPQQQTFLQQVSSLRQQRQHLSSAFGSSQLTCAQTCALDFIGALAAPWLMTQSP